MGLNRLVPQDLRVCADRVLQPIMDESLGSPLNRQNMLCKRSLHGYGMQGLYACDWVYRFRFRDAGKAEAFRDDCPALAHRR